MQFEIKGILFLVLHMHRELGITLLILILSDIINKRGKKEIENSILIVVIQKHVC